MPSLRGPERSVSLASPPREGIAALSSQSADERGMLTAMAAAYSAHAPRLLHNSIAMYKIELRAPLERSRWKGECARGGGTPAALVRNDATRDAMQFKNWYNANNL